MKSSAIWLSRAGSYLAIPLLFRQETKTKQAKMTDRLLYHLFFMTVSSSNIFFCIFSITLPWFCLWTIVSASVGDKNKARQNDRKAALPLIFHDGKFFSSLIFFLLFHNPSMILSLNQKHSKPKWPKGCFTTYFSWRWVYHNFSLCIYAIILPPRIMIMIVISP